MKLSEFQWFILLWVAGFLSLLTIAYSLDYFCSLLIKGGSHSGYASIMQMDEQEFGYEIIRARRQMKISQAQLASKLGISIRTLESWGKRN